MGLRWKGRSFLREIRAVPVSTMDCHARRLALCPGVRVACWGLPEKAGHNIVQTCSVKCMGVSDGWPSPDRSHAAFLYRLGRGTVLVDCGEPVSRGYRASGYDYDLIDRILISHLHLDHVGGLFMLLQGLWLEGRTRDLPIHMPAEGVESVQRMLRTGYIFDELLGFSLRFVALRAKRPIDVVPGVRVTPFPTTHLEGLRKTFQKRRSQRFESFSFRIECRRGCIVHSGDLGAVEDLAPMFDRPVDVLVCELAHVGLEQLGRFLRDREVKRVVLVHLPEALWRDASRTRRRARQALGAIPFTVAAEGEVVAL